MKEEQPAAAVPASLVQALQRIFRPLARLLISRSIPFPFASNLLRAAYVHVALDEFPIEGKRQTDSRLTLLTGVHRKDVKRLREEHRAAPPPPRAASLGSQLIARWTTLPEYLDEHGVPRPLSRLPSDSDRHSFESLVRSLNTDIRPRVVLDEWLRLGTVRIDEADRVVLDVRAFVPPPGSEEMTYYFGRNLHDHTAAAVHNMLATGPPFLERSVYYNNLSAAAVAELEELAKRRGMEVLQEVNARALRLQRRDSGKGGSSQRFNFGVYVFHEDESEEDPDAE